MNTLDPLAIIVERPGRRSRAESILWDLVHTSYPHALLGNLTIALARSGHVPADEIERLAQRLQPQEALYTWLDFVRCVQLKRHASDVSVEMRALSLATEATVIDDDRANHGYLAGSRFSLPSANQVLDNPEHIADLLLRSFYDTTTRSPRWETPFEQSRWICRHRLHNKPTHTPEVVIDEPLTTPQARELVITSLKRPRWHFIMTHNTIFLTDQKKRLWGLNRKH